MTPLGVPTYASNVEHRFGIPCPLLDNMTVEEARERAAEAHAGGRYITSKLSQLLADYGKGKYWPDVPRMFAGEGLFVRPGTSPSDAAMYRWGRQPEDDDPRAVLRRAWNTHVGTRTELASIARRVAAGGREALLGVPVSTITIKQAESMAGWPIYAAARQEERA